MSSEFYVSQRNAGVLAILEQWEVCDNCVSLFMFRHLFLSVELFFSDLYYLDCLQTLWVTYVCAFTCTYAIIEAGPGRIIYFYKFYYRAFLLRRIWMKMAML